MARSTFSNENAQNTLLWREAHFQVNMTKIPLKYLGFGTHLDLTMWKRCQTEEIDRLILNQSSNQSMPSISQLVNESVSQSVGQLVSQLAS